MDTKHFALQKAIFSNKVNFVMEQTVPLPGTTTLMTENPKPSGSKLPANTRSGVGFSPAPAPKPYDHNYKFAVKVSLQVPACMHFCSKILNLLAYGLAQL